MKKVNTKTKVIALSTAAVMTTAIYLKSDNVTNAEQYAQVSDNAIELNVDKQNKDTIKLSLSNFSDLAKSLQLSVKIEGNAIFTDDSIKWLVKSQNDDSNGKLRKIIRLSKMFCKSRKSWKNMPSGLLQTVLCDEKLQQSYERTDELFYYTMQEIVGSQWGQVWWLFYCASSLITVHLA